MIPTELQRLILMVALAATGYLLILAWTDDYGESAQRTVVSDRLDLGPDAGPNAGTVNLNGSGNGAPSGAISDIPAGDLSVAAADSDMPDASLVLPQGAPNSASGSDSPAAGIPGSKPTGIADSRIVKVYTDSLEVWIDLLGGDIVRARLPKFPVTLEQPDEAFTLLDRSGGRTYIAQSGLIGPTGLDKGGKRPLFAADAPEYRVESGADKALVLTAQHNGVGVEKTFLFSSDNYAVAVSYTHLTPPTKA